MSTSPTSFLIGYDDTDYVDVIPVVDCVRERSNEPYVHRVVAPSGKALPAESLITTKDDSVNLVYPDNAHNHEHGMRVGTLTLFLDSTRSRLLRATWSGGLVKVSVNVPLPFTPIDEPVLDRGGLRSRDVMVRKGQSAFRNGVLAAYGFTCAISRCTVVEALEAAHISPFAQSKNQNPRNGILLRRDLHALFDAELLGLNPNGTVDFSPEIRCSTYAGMASWFRPDQANLSPDGVALSQRWVQFSSGLLGK